MARSAFAVVVILCLCAPYVAAFVQQKQFRTPWGAKSSVMSKTSSSSKLSFFDVFQEVGPLGKGITVGKIQVALNAPNRGKDSIFRLLEQKARRMEEEEDEDEDNFDYGLGEFAHDVCLSLMRKKDDWVAASSDSQWFGQNDAGRAERLFNSWVNREAAKFEKEYIPSSRAGDSADLGGPTLVVVSVIIEIQGDETRFDGAGYSLQQTEDVLDSIATDCLVEDGSMVNAVEVFWTPSEENEVLTKKDIIVDFPELVTL